VLTKLPIAALVLLAVSASAQAQTYDSVGTRAQGMAGAFVAVADDATATWWNPAGLATGPVFNAIIERSIRRDPSDVPPAGPARQTVTSGFSIAFPSLGLSYYRLRISEIAPTSPTATEAAGRQDQGTATALLNTLVLSQFGVSTGQSIGNHLVVASTLKLLRGGSAEGMGAAGGKSSLDSAEDLDVSSETRGDIDVGAMAVFGVTRLGLSVKHLTEPAFGEGAASVSLPRQARAGIAFVTQRRGTGQGLTVAFDTDLTRTATALGDVRDLAGGAELSLNRFAVRGGFAMNTVGDARPSGSAGASLGIRRGLLVDGAITRGSNTSQRGWTADLRMTF